MTRCDVVVAGGGSAGLAAAVAAARAGAETVLIERGGLLGGMGAAAFVHTICGLYLLQEEPGAVFANEGFAKEFALRLIERGGAAAPVRMGRLDVLPHDPVQFAALADDYAAMTRNLRVWLHAELSRADCSGSRLLAAEVICRGRRESLEAEAFIDSTGDAALTALAGAACRQEAAECLQRPAYIALLQGCDEAWLKEEERLKLAHGIAGAVRTGELPEEALGAAFRSGPAPDQAFVTIDLAGGDSWDPCSPECLAAVEITGRRTALALVRFLQAKFSGMAGCRIAAWPARAGVRESRRLEGVYELSGEDVLSGREFEDGVVSAAWPLELREKPAGPRWRFPAAEKAARIPLRCLRHREVENLWTAGRCLSATHEAQASIRVMGTCLATGEAAGVAAAQTVNHPVEWNWSVLAGNVSKTISHLERAC